MCHYVMTGLFIGALAFPLPVPASQSKDQFAATEKKVDFGAVGIVNSVRCRTNDLLALRLLSDEDILVWDMASWKEKAKFRTKKLSFVNGFSFSPDGNKLAVGIWDEEMNHVIEVLDAENGRVLHAFKRVYGPVAFHPNGRLIALHIRALDTDNGLGKIQIRDMNNSDVVQREINLPKGTLPSSVDLAYAPDGKALAVVSAEALRKKGDSVKAGKRKVEIFDSDSGASRLRLECHDWTNCMQFDGAGTTLVTWTTVKSPQDAQLQQLRQLVYLWDPSNGKLRLQWKFPGPVRTVAFSADGRWLAAAIEAEKKGENNSISVRDLRTGTELCSIPIASNGPACRGLFFAKDGSLVYVGSSVLRSFKLEKK